MDWNDWLTLANSLGLVVEVSLVVWGASKLGGATTRMLRKRRGRG